MKVDTYLFGEVEVNSDNVIEFPQGLVAFENLKRYLLIHEVVAGESPESFTLQSLDDPHVAFQIVDPTVFGFDYELALTDAETSMLKIGQNGTENDVAVMLILFRQGEQKAPLNAAMRAPLIINTKSRLGLQKVIERARPNLMISNLSSTV